MGFFSISFEEFHRIARFKYGNSNAEVREKMKWKLLHFMKLLL